MAWVRVRYSQCCQDTSTDKLDLQSVWLAQKQDWFWNCSIVTTPLSSLVSQARPSHINRKVWGHQYTCLWQDQSDYSTGNHTHSKLYSCLCMDSNIQKYTIHINNAHTKLWQTKSTFWAFHCTGTGTGIEIATLPGFLVLCVKLWLMIQFPCERVGSADKIFSTCTDWAKETL